MQITREMVMSNSDGHDAALGSASAAMGDSSPEVQLRAEGSTPNSTGAADSCVVDFEQRPARSARETFESLGESFFQQEVVGSAGAGLGRVRRRAEAWVFMEKNDVRRLPLLPPSEEIGLGVGRRLARRDVRSHSMLGSTEAHPGQVGVNLDAGPSVSREETIAVLRQHATRAGSLLHDRPKSALARLGVYDSNPEEGPDVVADLASQLQDELKSMEAGEADGEAEAVEVESHASLVMVPIPPTEPAPLRRFDRHQKQQHLETSVVVQPTLPSTPAHAECKGRPRSAAIRCPTSESGAQQHHATSSHGSCVGGSSSSRAMHGGTKTSCSSGGSSSSGSGSIGGGSSSSKDGHSSMRSPASP